MPRALGISLFVLCCLCHTHPSLHRYACIRLRTHSVWPVQRTHMHELLLAADIERVRMARRRHTAQKPHKHKYIQTQAYISAIRSAEPNEWRCLKTVQPTPSTFYICLEWERAFGITTNSPRRHTSISVCVGTCSRSVWINLLPSALCNANRLITQRLVHDQKKDRIEVGTNLCFVLQLNLCVSWHHCLLSASRCLRACASPRVATKSLIKQNKSVVIYILFIYIIVYILVLFFFSFLLSHMWIGCQNKDILPGDQVSDWLDVVFSWMKGANLLISGCALNMCVGDGGCDCIDMCDQFRANREIA